MSIFYNLNTINELTSLRHEFLLGDCWRRLRIIGKCWISGIGTFCPLKIVRFSANSHLLYDNVLLIFRTFAP